tara:strand:+ start:8125 stop:8280 length:156 start_codon:yes stop_codon:yes gene_type:complete
MMKFFKNKLFIIILFAAFAVFAVTVIVKSSGDNDFLYHNEGDVFDVIDTLD